MKQTAIEYTRGLVAAYAQSDSVQISVGTLAKLLEESDAAKVSVSQGKDGEILFQPLANRIADAVENAGIALPLGITAVILSALLESPELELLSSKIANREREANHANRMLEQLAAFLLQGNISSKLIRFEFIAAMAAEIRANAHKGDWHAWKLDGDGEPDNIVSEIYHHVDKLVFALRGGTPVNVRHHCADVANLVMKADEYFGGDPADFDHSAVWHPENAPLPVISEQPAQTFADWSKEIRRDALAGTAIKHEFLDAVLCKHGLPGGVGCVTCGFDRLKSWRFCAHGVRSTVHCPTCAAIERHGETLASEEAATGGMIRDDESFPGLMKCIHGHLLKADCATCVECYGEWRRMPDSTFARINAGKLEHWKAATCDCTPKERDSGHKIGCPFGIMGNAETAEPERVERHDPTPYTPQPTPRTNDPTPNTSDPTPTPRESVENDPAYGGPTEGDHAVAAAMAFEPDGGAATEPDACTLCGGRMCPGGFGGECVGRGDLHESTLANPQ